MNIGIIHGFIGGGGGTEKTLHQIITALETTQHNVTLYTFSQPKIKSQKIKIKSILPISMPYFGLYQRAMESKLISKAKDEDLLIQTSGGLGIPNSPNQKIIVYCHNDFSNELDNSMSKYKGLWSLYYKYYYKTIKKFIENISDSRIFLISNSQFVHDSIKSKFGKNSTIIYPPVNDQEFSPTEKNKQVITLGRFSEEKNFHFGINVMSKLNFPYFIIGNTNTKSNIMYYEKLNSELQKIKPESRIQLLKNIPREQLTDILNSSKVYLHCSKETFGISVVEAIFAGCIPIVPNNSAHKETVPFVELRYNENDLIDAKNKIENALLGKYDSFLPALKDHASNFSSTEFQNSFLNFFEKLS